MSQSGTLGLVNDLSVKLAKQRKQLGSLVKDVKTTAAAELKWYHYVSILVCNNILVLIIGFLAASALYGISPSDGSFTANKITTTGMEVVSSEGGPDDLQDVRIESSASESQLSIESPTQSAMVFETIEGIGHYSWSSGSMQKLSLQRSGTAKADMVVLTTTNVTDVHFNPGMAVDSTGGGGVLVISNSLELRSNLMQTTNTSFTFAPAIDKDLVMSPTAGGKVHVAGHMHNAGALKVQLQVSFCLPAAQPCAK